MRYDMHDGMTFSMARLCGEDDIGLRIDSEDEEASSPKAARKESKADGAKYDKSPMPETNGSGSGYTGSNSVSARSTSDVFMSVDEDALEDGEIPTNEPVIKNFLAPPISSKRNRVNNVTTADAATCVEEYDECTDLANMKQNQYYKLNVFILSRSSTITGHTFTFTTNIKGQTYHGVLTDGNAPIIHNNQIQKRAAAAEKEKSTEEETNDKRELTPKPRGQKRVRPEDESKSPSKHRARHRSPQLREITNDPFVRCPHQQCGFRFLAVGDLNRHLTGSHVTGGTIVKEDVATQTMPEPKPDPQPCQVCKDRVKQEQLKIEEDSLKRLFANTEKTPKKEEEEVGADKDERKNIPALPSPEPMPRDHRLPTMPSLGQPPSAAKPVVPETSTTAAGFQATALPQVYWPNAANLPFMFPQAAAGVASVAAVPAKPTLSFPYANGISPIPSSSKAPQAATPVNSGDSASRHKIHELKTEPLETVQASPSTVTGRSITAGTSGNPMEMIRAPLRPPGLPAVASPVNPAAMNPVVPLSLQQQQMMIRQMFPAEFAGLGPFGMLANSFKPN